MRRSFGRWDRKKRAEAIAFVTMRCKGGREPLASLVYTAWALIAQTACRNLRKNAYYLVESKMSKYQRHVSFPFFLILSPRLGWSSSRGGSQPGGLLTPPRLSSAGRIHPADRQCRWHVFSSMTRLRPSILCLCLFPCCVWVWPAWSPLGNAAHRDRSSAGRLRPTGHRRRSLRGPGRLVWGNAADPRRASASDRCHDRPKGIPRTHTRGQCLHSRRHSRVARGPRCVPVRSKRSVRSRKETAWRWLFAIIASH